MDIIEDEISGQKAHELRIASGLNQQEFWRAVGVNQSSGCRYEQGKTAMPATVRILVRAVHAARLDLTASLADLKMVAQAQKAARTVASTNQQ